MIVAYLFYLFIRLSGMDFFFFLFSKVIKMCDEFIDLEGRVC